MTQADDLILVSTPKCFNCGRVGTVGLTTEQFNRMQTSSEPIQVVLSDLPAPLREQMITGTHPGCWDNLMGIPRAFSWALEQDEALRDK